MLQTLPLRAALSRLAAGESPRIEDLAVERWPIAAGERALRPPARSLPGQLDRVRGLEPQTVQAEDLARVRGGWVDHEPTVAYRLRGALLSEGFVYVPQGRLSLRRGRPRLWSLAPERWFDRRAMASSPNGYRYFGHWLSDDCSRALLADAIGPFVFADQPLTDHQRGYAARFGVELDLVERGWFDELVLVRDFGQNANKRRRYERMRAALAQGPSEAGSVGVFLRRGADGATRHLANEAALVEALVARGFTVADSRMPLDALLRALRGAPIVVGVEGSHLVHAVYTMREGGGLLTLQPPDRVANVLKDLTDCLGMTYGLVIGEGTQARFTVDLEELLRTIDLVLAPS